MLKLLSLVFFSFAKNSEKSIHLALNYMRNAVSAKYFSRGVSKFPIFNTVPSISLFFRQITFLRNSTWRIKNVSCKEQSFLFLVVCCLVSCGQNTVVLCLLFIEKTQLLCTQNVTPLLLCNVHGKKLLWRTLLWKVVL